MDPNQSDGANSKQGERYGLADLLALLFCIGVVAWWGFSHIIPHDAGLLADMALRVQGGLLPHLDFDDTYTGLLNWLHAAAFSVFGVRFTSLRICLLVSALPWMVVLQWMFRRVAAPWISRLFLVVTVMWTLPYHPESMPTWYNVFFATWGLAALWKYAETSHGRWLLVAGCCGGVSALFKIVGLFFLPATALYVLALPYLGKTSDGGMEGTTDRSWRNWMGRAVIVIVLGVVGTIPWLLIRRHLSVEYILLFALPAFAWVLWLLFAELKAPVSGGWARFCSMLTKGLCLLLGAAIPLGLFFAYFYYRGGLPALVEGVFELPLKRLTFAFRPLPSIANYLYGLPIILPLALVALSVRAHWPRWSIYLAPALALAFLGAPFYWPHGHVLLIFAFQSLVPALPILGGFLLFRTGSSKRASQARLRVAACMPVLIFINLIQFPYSSFIYFIYLFPIVALSVAVLLNAAERAEESSDLRYALRQPLCLMLLAFSFYPVIWMHGHALTDGGGSSWKRPTTESLSFSRGDSTMLVLPWINAMYGHVVHGLQEVAPKGSRIYAIPDCPEIPFLAEMTPVSRSIFPSLGSRPYPPPPETLMDELEKLNPDVILIHLRPAFSEPLPRATITRIYQDYRYVMKLGDSFLIFKKAPGEHPVP